jgi:MerR family transcriptional regulator, thiopeptide resistance regulator
MTTIGRLSQAFGLSRSTLLYYDRIGLLQPSLRDENGYRRYSAADTSRLGQICTYRRAGLRLADIRKILAAGGGRLSEILENRLSGLNEEVKALREQQRLIICLLRQPQILSLRSGPMDKERWTRLMRRAGFSDQQMLDWHVDFERRAPLDHQRFLELIGLAAGEIAALRRWSQSSAGEKG